MTFKTSTFDFEDKRNAFQNLFYFNILFRSHCNYVFICLSFNLKERPRSAVEQLCLAESTRPRMTVEEQMERIRRHQQACLREKKKALNVIGALDQSPLQSPSNLRDNPFRVTQVYQLLLIIV